MDGKGKAELRKRMEDRGRSGSCENIEEMLIRKRNESGEGKGGRRCSIGVRRP